MTVKIITHDEIHCDYCDIIIYDEDQYYYISPGEDCIIGGMIQHVYISDTLYFCKKEHLLNYISDHVE